ncbi:hypothetical protein Q5P01_006996 [Channa striata]|uniref:Uncharacterized protein n=1 Tax=Channa striata TaxID=64152 RepID=A0AA88N9Y1_CHASR|nr:hypothetical protein Q5P01_006996 [Channa striata]
MPRVSFAPPSLYLSFLPLLERLLPSLPHTVRDVDVPPLFQERFVLSGYRPVGLSWRHYVLSLFQIHNETLNVWSHLLAAVCVMMRLMMFTLLQGGGILGFRLQGPEDQGFSVDVSSLPLVLYVFSTVIYLSCSSAAHLLQSHSERAHYSLFCLDYMAVGIYQYGCALALCLYSSDTTWTQSMIFLPAAAVLAWFSCTTCCYAKLHFRHQYPIHRKLYQVVPVTMACLLDISPVAHRLATHSWTTSSALPLHFTQVVLFVLAGFFFSCPIPERFSPGRYDIVGRSHQLFHILSSLGLLAQQEALLQDFLWRRQALVRGFGEQRLLLACASFPCLTLCCVMTALAMTGRVRAQLMKEQIRAHTVIMAAVGGAEVTASWVPSSGVLSFFILLLLLSIFLTALCTDCGRRSFELQDSKVDKNPSALIRVVKLEEVMVARENPMIHEIQNDEKEIHRGDENTVQFTPWRSHLGAPQNNQDVDTSTLPASSNIYHTIGEGRPSGADADSAAAEVGPSDTNSVYAQVSKKVAQFTPTVPAEEQVQEEDEDESESSPPLPDRTAEMEG